MVRSVHCVSQSSISFLYISCVHKGIADATGCGTPSQTNTRGSLFEISGKNLGIKVWCGALFMLWHQTQMSAR